MLLLAALVATAAWSYGFAQEIPVQRPVSVTKSKGSVRLECHFKDISENFDGTTIHWYQQKANKGLERILYFSGSKAVDEGFQANKILFTHIKITELHCYCKDFIHCDYDKVFGSGTKLIVSDKESSPPANSEILQKKHKDQTIYVCLIEKFYPEVIQVTWLDEKNTEVTEKVVKGDPWKPTGRDEYSISSWLTVKAENEDKNYYCKYNHERKSETLPTQDSAKPAPQDCITYRGNGTVFNRDHLTHRTAYLVYIVLLLKSSMYYLIVLFFIYRTWAPTKHQGKKA
ncbi:T-cell receptor gamma alternate reading frame protein [Morus bassanus]